MNLPSHLKQNTQWVFLGPMGPSLMAPLQNYPLLCLDGGAHFTNKMDLWVGDGDSFTKEVKAEHKFKHSPEKDQSDLALALSLFQDKRPYLFHFWGLLGGRRDHEMFNLGESLSFLEDHTNTTILFYGENGKIFFELKGQGDWDLDHHGPYSLGTLTKGEILLSGKCRYQISHDLTLTPLSSQGLSNIGLGEMNLKNSHPLFLYYPEGK
jgi:thiamine pyrophosphokinase